MEAVYESVRLSLVFIDTKLTAGTLLVVVGSIGVSSAFSNALSFSYPDFNRPLDKIK